MSERCDLLRALCAVVHHVRSHFVVQGDPKPANTLVDSEGHPRGFDFGVATCIDDSPDDTGTGMFAGVTVEYAALEQVSGGSVSAVAEVYALGVFLYQLLAVRLTFQIGDGNLRATAATIPTCAGAA